MVAVPQEQNRMMWGDEEKDADFGTHENPQRRGGESSDPQYILPEARIRSGERTGEILERTGEILEA